MKIKRRNFFLDLFIAIVAIYLIFLIFLFFYQRNLLYHPAENNYSGDNLKVKIEELGEAGLSKADAKKALDAFVGATTGALKKGDRISLVGFGSFSITRRAARAGRNPKTGAVIQIAAKNTVKFKAGADLSSSVN